MALLGILAKVTVFVQSILYQKRPDSLDYVPSIMRRDLKVSCSSAAYSHFEHVSCGARIQEHRRKEYKKANNY